MKKDHPSVWSVALSLSLSLSLSFCLYTKTDIRFSLLCAPKVPEAKPPRMIMYMYTNTQTERTAKEGNEREE
jgi:hypothetical protein